MPKREARAGPRLGDRVVEDSLRQGRGGLFRGDTLGTVWDLAGVRGLGDMQTGGRGTQQAQGAWRWGSGTGQQ